MARLLLDFGASPHASDKLGATPLSDAQDEMRALLSGGQSSYSKEVMQLAGVFD